MKIAIFTLLTTFTALHCYGNDKPASWNQFRGLMVMEMPNLQTCRSSFQKSKT